MARKLRVEYQGAIYHVMNRGDHREAIFRDDQDRLLFLMTLAETCEKTAWQVHAYCLMANHFHLCLETPRANLVAGMKWFLGTYTARFNRRHKLFGHLFSGRYKALIVDGSQRGYLHTVCDYIHLNPARAKLIPDEDLLRGYRWSSYPEYLKAPKKRPVWLRVDRLLGEMRIPKDSAAGRRMFERMTEERRAGEPAGGAESYQKIRRGWYLGDKQFKKELLEQMADRRGESHYGEELEETEEQKAEGIVCKELRRVGWREQELQDRPKCDGRKVALAMELRRRTTMPLKWVAQRLNMGTWTNLSNLLSQQRRRGANE
jgi:putative transposase